MRTLILLSILVLALPATAGEELMVNGGFEQWEAGAPVGWTLDFGAQEGAGPESVAATAAGEHGGLALSLSGDTATRRWFNASQDVDVQGASQVTVRGRMAVRDVRPDGHRYANCQLMVILKDAQGQILDRALVKRMTGTQPWTDAELVYPLPPQAAALAVICFLSMSGEALFDDVSVTVDHTATEPTGTRTGDWRLDFDRLVQLLEAKHPDPYTVLDRESFVSGLHDLAARADELTDLQLAIEAQLLVARLGDAHTGVSLPGIDEGSVPVKFHAFGNEVRVTRAAPPLADLVGGALTAVDGRDAAEVMAEFGRLISSETEAWRLRNAVRLLNSTTLLHALGLIDAEDAVTYTVRHDDGRKVTLTATRATPAQDTVDAAPATPPLFRSGSVLNAVTWLDDSATVYLRYGTCRDLPQISMCALQSEAFRLLLLHPTERFVLDLRGNSGGSSHQLQDLARTLGELRHADRPVRTFVLTDAGTFSSGVLDAAVFIREAGATTAGAPMGQAVNHFGQVWKGELPLSGMILRCSTKAFAPLGEGVAAFQMDIPVTETWEDFTAGRDRVLEAVLER